MMHIQMKNTLRTMLVVSVASGLMLSACGYNKETKQQQPKMDTGNLHAPRNNPSFEGNVMTMPQDGMRAPAGNPDAAPQNEMMQADARMEMQQPMQAAPQEKKGGLFDWAWARKPEESQPQVNTMERRVPKLNQDPAGADTMAMASYEAAAPVGDVEMSANAGLSPQSDIVVADEVIMMDDTFTPVMPQEQVAGEYPNLGDVPARPERIDAINQADARMADLEQARAETYAQTQSMEAQYAADMEGSLLPQAQPQTDVAVAPQSDIDAEFAALVSADGGTGNVPVVVEEQPAVVVSGDAGMYDQAPAPIVMTDTAPQDTNWQPAPLTPQTQPVQENQWVSLEQPSAEAQMAVPVEQVDVSSPQVAAVSPVPVMAGNNAVGGIELTPPSSFGPTVRTLPESRYAARREAVYMQRYSRMQGAGY